MTKLQSAWMRANAPLAARELLHKLHWRPINGMETFLIGENPNMFVLREILSQLDSPRKAGTKVGLIKCIVDEIWGRRSA